MKIIRGADHFSSFIIIIVLVMIFMMTTCQSDNITFDKRQTTLDSNCTVDYPPPGGFTCEQQKGWGKCNENWMKGYCCISCPPATSQCDDIPPPTSSTSNTIPQPCGYYKDNGLCGQPYMTDYCCQSCKAARQPVCQNDNPPDPFYSCQQQKEWGKCSEKWMEGYCCITCGLGINPNATAQTAPPVNTCVADSLPDPAYSCEQQREWGKCYEDWMKGHCCISCPPLSTSYLNDACLGRQDDVSPASIYTCTQLVSFGKCNEPWMKGYCCQSCLSQSYGNCTEDILPPGGGDCSQFKSAGKCDSSSPYCCKSCSNFICPSDTPPSNGMTCEAVIESDLCNNFPESCCVTCGRGIPKYTNDTQLLDIIFNKMGVPNWKPFKDIFWFMDENGRVKKFIFNQQGGQIRIPTELFFLSQLEVLEWMSGPFGILSPLISNLKNLKRLNLFFNQFWGTIPPEIGDLSNLEYLSLEQSYLKGYLPTTLGKLKKLKFFSAGKSILWGTLPSELGLLSNLTHLALFKNGLTGTLPSEYALLTQLQNLIMDGNKLSGTIPSRLGGISTLQMLSLSYNSFSGDVPQWLERLTGIQLIDLSFLNLTGSVPDSLSTSLQTLSLSGNRLSGTLPNLLRMRHLISLKLASTSLAGTLPSDWPPNIKEVDLSYNHLEGSISPNLFQEGIQTILLQWNKLTGVIPNTVGKYSLSQLTLASNSLNGTIPPEIGGSFSLKVLNLQNNSISGTLPPEMKGNSNLVVFNLDDNHLSGTIPDVFSWMQNLQVFHIENNRVSGNVPNMIRFLTQAKEISLKGNSLTLVSWYFLPCADHVVNYFGNSYLRIDLSNNLIVSLPSSNDRLCPANDNERISIDLSKNQIKSEISTILESIPLFSEMDLSGNLIKGTLGSSNNFNPFLKTLTFSNNFISGTIPKDFLQMYPALEILLISQNLLSGSLPTQLLPQLKSLDLSLNNLTGDVSTLQNIPPSLSLVLTKNHFYGNLSQSAWANESKQLRIDFNDIECSYLPLWCAGTDVSSNGTAQCYPCLSTCGDGLRFTPEQCDDGNTISDDGCDSNCIMEEGWTCSNPTSHLSSSVLLPNPSTCKKNASSNNITLIIILVIIPFILLICFAVLAAFVMKKLRQKDHFITQLSKKLGIQSSFIIDEADLEIEKKIGEGNFGAVYEGMWNKTTIVAIKKMKLDSSKKPENNNRQYSSEIKEENKEILEEHKEEHEDPMHSSEMASFIAETKTIASIPPHPHIVQFLGVCISKLQSCIFLVTQFIPSDNMQKYLQKTRGQLNLLYLVQLIKGVAAGMSHLHKYHIIHNDLAARNVLIEEVVCRDKEGDMSLRLVPKVSDFGLASSGTLERTDQQKVPIRWTAPEVLVDVNKVSTHSDVWSFGIVVYEVITLGSELPYENLDNSQVMYKVVKEKYILPCPTNCMSALYGLMKECWAYEPEGRPSFDQINKSVALMYSTISGTSSESKMTGSLLGNSELRMMANRMSNVYAALSDASSDAGYHKVMQFPAYSPLNNDLKI